MKLLERKFAIPGSTALFAIANDVGKMGIDFKVLVLVSSMALIWAGIECAADIARLKYGPKK